MMKLFTIGDSISQGFMSGAAARTDLCYSTILSKHFKIADYQYPNWPLDGLPVNIETIFRKLEKNYGVEINTLEWALAIANTIPSYLNGVEKYYEKGAGAADKKYPTGEKYFHNLAVRGFNVSDSWLITPKYCQDEIAKSNSSNGTYAAVDKSFLRTALKVLNPQLDDEHQKKSQIDWLKYHSENEGVENVMLWLGANNALGTILKLKVIFTEGKGTETKQPSDGLDFNLWHPNDFATDYKRLLQKIDNALANENGKSTKVFIGTIPLITIAPLAKGVGDTITVKVDGEDVIYSKYYTYFPFDEAYAFKTGINLSFTQALHIDNCIRAYNKTILQLVAEHNKINTGRYHIVDLSGVLDQLAFKRNGGSPKYKFPEYFDFKYPLPNTKYYHADVDGTLKQGGIFSLDGVHPTAIAHGIIAYEILKVMKTVGVKGANPNSLDWDAIFKTDDLYNKPISVIHEIYDNTKLAEWIMAHVKKLAHKNKS